MSTIDEVLRANERYAQQFTLGHLALPPARHLAIVACMDARLMVDQLLGLQAGEAHIIRNAGDCHGRCPAITDSVASPARHAGVHDHQSHGLWDVDVYR